ncbi:multicopper oxidase domain-containing protein [Candidatus Nitrospira allomarina]|uniref:Multicopper oxidase domain-containing protein n=1 Tax=Candidatus Nitrospira allomarina TaxID=3020900 RepID=A0AA96JQJ9_9BACT|nr:multicopper oxidase domain-containing protein [Candidatus Nitrospira allomarina]WNM56532.1 multicopper oxidase domain-containing protein [Candidatus Nitrospira allomarina]
MYHGKSKFLTASIFLALMGGAAFWATPTFVSAENASPSHAHQTGMPAQSPGWAEQLKGQTIVEDAMEGRAERAALVEQQHQRMMEQMQKDMEHKGADTGAFDSMSMIHQYGGGPANGLLASTPGVEPVSMKGGLCPKTAPVRNYDVSAINVEISLNQWLDYYPGYMYALTGNIDKIREEEAKNAEAREKEGHVDPGAVNNGIQDQWIQPLVIRGNQGDCVKVTLRNQLEFGEEVSLHINGSDMVMSQTGQPALTTNPDSVATEGQAIEMEWYIHPDTQEGGKQFHTFSNDRELTVMGLFGVFVVEPRGSNYYEPLGTGPATEATSGWQVMIDNGDGPDFREFVLIYHEVGDEAFRPVNKHGDFLPQRDPLTDAYRPGARALNYRSEPFGINNMHVQHEYFGFEDESMAYSSYTFGDAAPTIPRSYLGDPAKFRIVHGGSEVFHSHHPHGGSIRWQRSPRATQMPVWSTGQNGPVKFPVIRTKSDRVDVEVIGPSEALDLETECGSGLCQWLAGDFLFHCHVAHHYVAGMWGYWRVYNSLQEPGVQNDVMAPLRELPDRLGRIHKPVTSDQLVGKTVNWFGKQFKIVGKGKSDWKADPAVVNIKDWVEMQLSNQGKPGHKDDEAGQMKAYDATVMDWVWDGSKAMSEKEPTLGENPKYRPEWQGYKAGERRAIWFEPSTGKVAWPWLTPHFGKRAPFSNDHNPAPWLEMIRLNPDGTRSVEPAKAGENGSWSLCPDRAGSQDYKVHFIKLPIELSAAEGKEPAIVDPNGLLYVVHEEEEEVRANNDKKFPLVVRANVYDCIDWTLTSEWLDDDITNFQSSKINTHFHFFQFDNQASDGVISGFSYEQSMRPFTQFEKKSDKGLPVPMNAKVTKAAKKGDKTLEVSNAKQYHVGIPILIGADNVKGQEVRRIVKINGNTLTFAQPLKNAHPVKDIVTVEYVRQRFWVDADVGSVFWHDHAFGGTTWPHGAVGTMIAEPFGSTWHDPKTGKRIRSGPVADIHAVERVGHDVAGSFRELMVHIMDTVPHTVNIVTAGNPPGQPVDVALEAGRTVSFIMPPNDRIKMTPMPFLNGGTHTTGGAFNFRAEPFAQRLVNNPDPSKLFSSAVHGDPSTAMIRAYLGDAIVFRLIDVTMNESNVFTLSGHTFWSERYAQEANRKHSLHIGIAERYDLVIPEAGGPRHQAGDYMFFNGRSSKFSEGSWGLIRVLDKPVGDLQPLPNKAYGKEGMPERLPVCPKGAPVKSFSVVALDHPGMSFNNNAPETIEVDFERKIELRNPEAKIYVLEDEVQKVGSDVQPMPLTLRANVGDCLQVKLTNKLKEGRASFSAFGLAFDPKDSQGLNLGNNPGDQTVAPGESRMYTYYADPFNGETQTLVWDWGNVSMNPRNGLFGGIIIGPKGSQYRDPKTGEDISLKNSWNADVIVDRTIQGNESRVSYRDVALYFQDEDNIIGTSFMPYVQNVAGLTGVNYRAEPYLHREEAGCSLGRMFQPCQVDKPQDPATPVIEAHAGDKVRIHVFGASSEQNGMFTVEKHEWPIEPFLPGADMISTVEFSGSEGLDVFLPSAGGRWSLTGDYVWSNGRLPYSQSGQWGYLRVLPDTDQRIQPLDGSAMSSKQAALEESSAEPRIIPTIAK